MTDDGIYKSTVKYQFLTTELTLPTSVVPKFTYTFSSKTFVATNKGLYIIAGNKLDLVGNIDDKTVTSICEFNGRLLVGFDNSGGVKCVDITASSLTPISAFNSCSVKGLGNYNNGEMLVVVTAGGIRYAANDLQKSYLIASTTDSTLAAGIGEDVFVVN